MKKILRTLHVFLIVIMPIAFFYLKVTSNENDPMLKHTNQLFGILSLLFGGYVTYMTIKDGRGDSAKKNLINKYRSLLGNSSTFLILSNLLLVCCFTIILYQAFYFRNVEFVSDKKIELFQSFTDGSYKKIGDIDGNKITLFRIRNGKNYFMYKEPLADDFIVYPPTNIPFSWDVTSIIRIKLTNHDKFESTF